MAFTGMLFIFNISYDSLLLKVHDQELNEVINAWNVTV